MEAQRVKISRDEWEKLSSKEHAEICTMIIETLGKKLIELSDLFDRLCVTYPQEIAMAGISVVASLDSKAFEEPYHLVLQGTTKGLLQNMTHINERFAAKYDSYQRKFSGKIKGDDCR